MLNRIIKLSILFILLLAGYNTAFASFTISRPSTNNLGLVGHWTFDGKNVVSGVALDSAGSNNGNLVGIATSTFYAAGKIGQGFNFDGTNDYINIGTPASLENITSKTVAAWVNPSSLTGSGSKRVVDKEIGTPDAWGFGIYPTGSLNNRSVIYIQHYTISGVKYFNTPVDSIAANRWQHIVLVYTKGDTTVDPIIYINGVPQTLTETDSGSPSGTADSDAGIPLKIGSISDASGNFFHGLIDDVRVYNRALSGGGIKSLYNQGVSKFNKTPTNTLTSGLVGHWTFDGKNVVSGVALDSTGNANNGNLVGIATSTFYSAGKIGQGFNFDGTDDYIILPASNSFGLTNAITQTAWVKTSTTTGQRIINFYRASASTNLMIATSLDNTGADNNDGKPLGSYRDSANAFKVCRSATAINDNSWHNVVWAISGTTGNLYVDNVLKATCTDVHNANTFTFFSQNANIGTYSNDTDDSFTGLIDEVRIYNRALSAGEIKMLYNMGR